MKNYMQELIGMNDWFTTFVAAWMLTHYAERKLCTEEIGEQISCFLLMQC